MSHNLSNNDLSSSGLHSQPRSLALTSVIPLKLLNWYCSDTDVIDVANILMMFVEGKKKNWYTENISNNIFIEGLGKSDEVIEFCAATSWPQLWDENGSCSRWSLKEIMQWKLLMNESRELICCEEVMKKEELWELLRLLIRGEMEGKERRDPRRWFSRVTTRDTNVRHRLHLISFFLFLAGLINLGSPYGSLFCIKFLMRH